MKRWATLGILLWAVVASANERHFSYTYETAVLPQGARELEIWATLETGRDAGYVALDHRFEYEVGLTRALQTSLYVNLASALPGGISAKEAELSWSLSNEWKLKLLDPVADPVGFGVYGELEVGYHEAELEAKVLLDKRVGSLLAAFNLVGAHEWEFTPGAPNRDDTLEGDLGLTWFFTRSLSAGIEARSNAIFSSDEGFEGNAFSAGPVVTWSLDGVWATLTFLPQLAGVKADGAVSDSSLELVNHERYDVRLLVGFHL